MATGISSLGAPVLSQYKASVKWKFTKSGKSKLSKIYVYYTWDAATGKDTKETNKDKAKTTSDSEDYNRASWYPFAGKPKMKAVHVRLRGKKGSKWWSYTPTKTTTIHAPAEPGLGASVDNTQGTVTFSATSASNKSNYERYDTALKVMRESNVGETAAQLDYATNTATSWSRTVNIADANALQPGEYIRVYAQAWNRGLAGDSGAVTAEHVFAQPAMAQILQDEDGMVGYSGTTASGGQAYVGVQTNSRWDAPVDSVTLQVLRSSTATTPEAAGALEGWADVDNATDDATCTGLTCPLTSCWPDAGTRTWFRLKTVHDNYTVNGKPVMFGYFEPPKTEVIASGRAEILVDNAGTLTRSGDDGKSAVVVVAFDGDDDNTGTEISWSKFEDAWMSTDDPNVHLVTWEDETSQSTSQVLPDSSTLYVRGLEQNTPYYFKARRYLVDAEGDTIYGAYNGPVTVVPVSAPSSVVLRASSPYVPRGQGVTLTWTFDSDAAQEWYDIDGGTKHWGGQDALGSLSIPAEDLEGDDTWTFAVTMSTGGAAVTSEPVTVHIVDAPTCSLSLPFGATLTAQPASMTVVTDTPGVEITAAVIASGGTGERPERDIDQFAGDVVWGARIAQPEWTESQGAYTATVAPPAGLEFLDGCSYTATAGVTDPTTGLSASADPAAFDVTWAHQADGGSATVTASAQTLEAFVLTIAPEDAAQTDMCDVYRVTPDGAQRITPPEGVAYGTAITDPFAPYGSDGLAYRIATRTADGDVDWDDVPYTLPGKLLALDWDGGSLRLAYNQTVADGFAKDFESRAHMGQLKASGYWGESVERSMSLTGSFTRWDSDAQEALRSLARHPGAVFVRLPNGVAFPANVDVSEISEGYDSGAVQVSFDAVEVAMTDEFRATLPPEPEQEGE